MDVASKQSLDGRLVGNRTTLGLLQFDLTLDKGARDRAGEEELVSRLLLNALAQSYGTGSGVTLGLTGVEQPESGSVPHQPPIQRLLSGDINHLTVGPDGKMQAEGRLVGRKNWSAVYC